MAGLVIVDKSDGVGKVLLNRPDAGNALTPALLDAVIATLADFAGDPAVGAVLVTGIGKVFCAGDDREALARGSHDRYQAAVHAVLDCPKPVICAPRGECFDTGLELALAADLRIASDTARFAATWAGAGIVPPLAHSLLPAAIGPGRAADCLLGGAVIGATEAAALGLVHQAVPDAELKATATARAEALAAAPAESLAAIKRLLRRSAFAAAMR